MTTTPPQSRSGLSLENLQESLDANQGGKLGQYLTPPELAYDLHSRLRMRTPATCIDPQSGGGALLTYYSNYAGKFGIELSDVATTIPSDHTAQGHCLKAFSLLESMCPTLRFACANANPPFGARWKQPDGTFIDSTLATWNWVKSHGNTGFFIGPANAIEKFGINIDPHVNVFFYERRKASLYWENMREDTEIGVLCWEARPARAITPIYKLEPLWKDLNTAIKEESSSRPDFNIYLDGNGFVRTYLSIKDRYTLERARKIVTSEVVAKLAKIDGTHPAALCVDVETRRLLQEFTDTNGTYRIQPEARQAMLEALKDSDDISIPIMPCTDFESVAYADHLDTLLCIKSHSGMIGKCHFRLTAGRRYPLSTGSYKFTRAYKRNKVHFDEQNQRTFTREHDCTLTGQDRYILLTDDDDQRILWLDSADDKSTNQLPESLLWELFERPEIKTVADTPHGSLAVAHNREVLEACAMAADFTYYNGQLNYVSRMGVRDAAMVAAETGSGKTNFAISLITLKSPHRTLIIAPQGTLRTSKSEEDDEDEDEELGMSAPQWIAELTKFAPHLQIWEIFNPADYERICRINGGTLPPGVYVSYYQAMFCNGARENAPSSWIDDTLNKWAVSNDFKPLAPYVTEDGEEKIISKRYHCDSIGKENEHGIRCIIKPCLSTEIGHLFDCVIVDESHKAKGEASMTCQMLIRMQPKFKYCLSASPVHNTVIDLFPIMGWLCVPDWYKGNRRNSAWPYAREDMGKFKNTFLTMERDLTEEEEHRKHDKRWRGKCIKPSPIISSPARLLKLLKPSMAFISKKDCRSDYIPPKIIDVRVPMGKEQAVLYGHFTNRANIKASHPLVRARKQVAYLRAICADPAGFQHGGPKVHCNMNPKVISILELTRDILAENQQVVIINSRIGLTDAIADRLALAGITMSRIDSTVPAQEHARQAALFKAGRTKVMLMGIMCAAAYSFDRCENLIVGSLEYSSGSWMQAIGRIDRLTNMVVKRIYCILNQHSIEEVQFDVVSVKGDAANLCLRGKRVPRSFIPVDVSDVLAKALECFDLSGATPESECDAKWPMLLKALLVANHKQN